MSDTLESVIIKDLIENLNLWAESYSGKPISHSLFRAAAMLGELERRRDEARKHLKEIEEYGTEEINAAIDLRRNLAQALVDLDDMQYQRDEAREALEFRRELYKVQEQCLETARRERDEANQIISSALAVLPVGYIPKHTAESIPNRIADLCNEIAKSERERDEWRKCAEKLAAIIGAPDEEQSLLWKTDDEINEAWSAFNKLKEGTK
jgi:hypothetical protein